MEADEEDKEADAAFAEEADADFTAKYSFPSLSEIDEDGQARLEQEWQTRLKSSCANARSRRKLLKNMVQSKVVTGNSGPKPCQNQEMQHKKHLRPTWAVL